MKKLSGTLKFSRGLIPAAVCDAKTNELLMVAYMNREALEKTLETGETHFYSRSRKRLWHKGESSGHFQTVQSIRADCDQDALLVKVHQIGVACHTGARSCFFHEIAETGQTSQSSPDADSSTTLEKLSATIADRKTYPSQKSYTSLLFEGGIDRILKKVGEEAGEFIISAKNKNKKEIVHETADLLYHLLVALAYHKIPFVKIEEELRNRSNKQDQKARGKHKEKT